MDILLLPFRLVWLFFGFLLTVLGKLLGVILGLIFMIMGVILCFTLIASFIGIPLFIIGFLLVLRSIF